MKKSFEDLFKDESPQRIVYEYAYQRIGREYLNRIAKKQELSEKDIEELLDDPESLCDEIGDILDPLFGAVTTKNDKADGEYVYSYEEAPKEKYFNWFHRYDHKILEDVYSNDITIDKDGLQSATANYLNNSDYQDDWLDWYCADLLCYNEYIETLKAVATNNNGIIASLMFGSKNWLIKLSGHLVRIFFFLIKWGIWLFILFMLLETGDSETWANVAAGLLLLLTAFSQFNKWKARKKMGELLNSMGRAYAVLATRTFSWEILWRSLDESRQLGAIWPGELWRLIELRRQKNLI